MAYLQQDDKHLISDILTRKEFYWNKKWKTPNAKFDIIPRFLLEDAISRSGNLQLTSYQNFISNYINPNTPYKRILMKWQTGTGKSIGALSIAMNFIKYYKLEQEIGNIQIGSVFIIGFSERVFKNELLRFPEFGFLSREERSKLDKLKSLAATGSKQDVDRYHDMITKIKRRFGNRKGNGFFKFFGYKAFVNRILVSQEDVNISDMTEENIRVALANGKITYNQELLDQFKNSLMICDEIHNVYNSVEKNNWGIAIQAVLDKEPTCRAVFASATPLNNSPTEIIDLLNLLLPKDQLPDLPLKKQDFFTSDKKLKPGALEKIADLSKGRVSYLRDVNPQYYPSVKMHGEELREIPYLKFIRCPMSSFQYNTYKQIYMGALSQDSQYIVDFVLENPENKNLGLYQTSTIKTILPAASAKWKAKYKLDYRDEKIVGDALKRDKLSKYSSKYATMLDHISDVIKKENGKIFIYHNIVHMSGVLFIEEVLHKNGFIDEFGGSSDNTICMKCGKIRKQHHKSEILGSSSKVNDKVENNEVGASGKEVDDKEVDANVASNVVENNKIGASSNIVNDDNSEQIVGASDKVTNEQIEDPIITVQKKGKDKLIWFRGEKNMATIKRERKNYLIHSSGMDNDLINGKSYALLSFGQLLDNLENIPIVVQVPHYAPRLGEWLLNLGFVISKQTVKYTFMTLLEEKHGGSNEIIGDGGSSIVDSVVGSSKIANTSIVDSIANTSVVGSSVASAKYRKNKTSKGRAKIKVVNSTQRHKFTPARYILAHSDIDKGQMEHSIEKFNDSDNADGSRYMILVGSKIMKESYNIKAIQNVFIMGKPDNIPTLLQIRGRAIRKGSHRDLPPEKRQVNIKIFTSCLPEKQKIGLDKGKWKLSYEEEKYKDKITAFKVMQQIEKVLHENAIDSLINQDLINRTTPGEPDSLDALPFQPNIDKKYFKELNPSEINTETFDIYYAQKEVEICKYMIKRFFIEVHSVWTYEDLFEAIKTDPLNYETEHNTRLFTEDNFIIAINQLAWNRDQNYVNPLIGSSNESAVHGGSYLNQTFPNQTYPNQTYPNQTYPNQTYNDTVSGGYDLYTPNAYTEDSPFDIPNDDCNTQSSVFGGASLISNYVIDKMFDINDKIISLPGGQDGIIIPIADTNTQQSKQQKELDKSKQYYILFPIDANKGEPIIDIELPYRIIGKQTDSVINMNSFIQTKRVDFDYDDKKRIFYRKYIDVSIENMENVVCEYGTTFHIKFLEECIDYVFRAWTDPTLEKSEYHEFYFKMLYYYDLLSLVMWAYTCKPRIFNDYKKYAIAVRAKDIKLKILSKYEKREEEIADISPDDASDLATSGVINLLKTSISRTSNVWIPREFREEYDKILNDSYEQFRGMKKKNKSIQKVSAKLLPIGHYISKFPRIYHPEKGWTEDPTYIQNDQEYIENDYIIGYDEKSKTGVHVRFKIRNPIHNIKKHKDSRLIEKGTVCKSKSKSYLRAVAKKIDIILPEKFNVEELCALLRSKLIRLELKERIKKSKIKYFYFHYEQQLPM